MEIDFSKKRISFTKELNHLDKMALDFSELLTNIKIKHAFVSGYVAILFGRNRSSEDIDVICEKLSFNRFSKLWDTAIKKFECIITSDVENAYNEYLKKKTAVRFAHKGEIIPNIELKFVSNDMHKKAIASSIKISVNDRLIPIASFEQQIAYKIYMGSEKDIEDARFLFKLFDDNLDKIELENYINILKLDLGKARLYLGW